MTKFLPLFVLLILLASACHAATDEGLAGYYPFDGTIVDASGGHHDAIATAPHFAPGHQGQALDAQWKPVEIANAEALQLNVGLVVDCWVYWDKKPAGYEQIIFKEKEYQLRVDGEGEGGRFSFFVYLNNGWEPRVSLTVPKAGHWYHVVAKWTGTESILDVDGDTAATPRLGVPVPDKGNVSVGNFSGRLDDLRILNPVLFRNRQLQTLLKTVPADKRATTAEFGGAHMWEGWQPVGGATMDIPMADISARFPNAGAMLVNPGLDVPLGRSKWVSIDLDVPNATMAHLSFITDHGQGMVAFPVWGGGRTSLVELSALPQWTGQLKLLGLSFNDDKPHQVALKGLWVSKEPEGNPYVYVRSLAPGRAALRAGREESIIAVVRNLGKIARDLRVTLTPPAGVTLLDEATKTVPELDYEGLDTVTWKVRADAPLAAARFNVGVTESAVIERAKSSFVATFTAPLNLPKADYVPVPKPAKSKYLALMHYCPLWKEGTHYGWEKIEPWPERRPEIGWYDEGTPEVADWHIKVALEHGIQGFIYCWYRDGFDPQIRQQLGHAIHDGLLKARYRDMFKFAIMWENGCGTGCKDEADLLNNLMPFWINNYFKQPSYVKIDNKPLLYVWVPQNVARDVGGWDKARDTLNKMREACKRAGLDGLYIVGCVTGVEEDVLKRMGESGWDASSAYGVAMPPTKPQGRDVDGAATNDYRTSVLSQELAWRGKKAVGALPDIVDVMMGWDPRPWGGYQGGYLAPASPEAFKEALRRQKAVIDATPGNGLDKRIVVFDNWCEFGEGHYLEPTSGFGFKYLDAIKEVFAPDSPPCQDITPEDVGLPCPEKVYLERRAAMGGSPARPRTVVDNLVASYSFEEPDVAVARDSSACGFVGVKQNFVATDGKVGKGFQCDGGSVSIPAHKLLWPADGISVELWMKATEANESDRWMVNSVGAEDTGYRLGPVEPQSHLPAANRGGEVVSRRRDIR